MPLYAYLSAIIVSLISFVGLSALSFKETLLKKCIFVLVSVATGALLGDAFIHLIPESFENGNNPVSTSLFILGGILVFFILEKILHWHHSHEGKHNIHGISHEEEETETTKPLGTLILASDGFHNLIDGIIIGTSYAISIEVGIATTVAIILH